MLLNQIVPFLVTYSIRIMSTSKISDYKPRTFYVAAHNPLAHIICLSAMIKFEEGRIAALHAMRYIITRPKLRAKV